MRFPKSSARLCLIVMLLSASPALAIAAVITGHLQNAETNAAITNYTVGAFSSKQPYSSNPVTTASTDGNGDFSLSGLGSGPYYIQAFAPNSTNNFQITYWDGNQGSTNYNDSVSVPGGASGVNMHLKPGGTITATFSSVPPAPIQGMSLLVYPNTACGGQSLPSFPATSGTNQVTAYGIPPGTVYLHGWNNTATPWVTNWYSGEGKSGTLDCNQAAPVTVTTSAPVGPIPFYMVQGGIVTGQLTKAQGGAAITSGQVTAYYGSACGSRTWLLSTSVNGSGAYTLSGVPTTDILLQATSNQGQAPVWWDNSTGSTSCANALPITVVSGQTYPEKNMALPEGGTITGTVRNTAGEYLSGIYVNAYDAKGYSLGQTQTNGSGIYVLSNLPAGTALVWANGTSGSNNYISKWADGGTGAAYRYQAQGVPVTGGNSSTANFTLAAGGTIAGRITGHTGDGLSGVRVSAFPTSPLQSANSTYSATTNSNGDYILKGLPDPVYIQANAAVNGINEASAWWNGSGGSVDPSAARPIAVTPGATVPNKNIQLDQGGTITGKITNASNTGLAGITVQAGLEVSCGMSPVASTTTDGSGNYVLVGVPAGKIHVKASGGGYVHEWWSASGANPDYNFSGSLVMTSGDTVNNIDLTLYAGGSVSGTIVDSGTGKPLYGMIANAYVAQACNSDPFDSAVTDADGHYTISGLPAGPTVYVRSDATLKHSSYKSLWWNGSSGADWCDAASSFIVSTSVPQTGKDLALTKGGTITGTITDSSGHGLSCIKIKVLSGDACTGHHTGGYLSDYAGNYTWYGAPTGTNNVYVRTDAAATNKHYQDRYWDGGHGGTASCSQATALTVDAVTPQSGINMVLNPPAQVIPLVDLLLSQKH